MPVLDPLGLPRCAVCWNAFAYECHEEATAWLRERGVLDGRSFVCRTCIARVRAEYGPLPFERERV